MRRTFIPTDAEIILKIRPNLQKQDSLKWGLTRNGCYSSQSGYRFLDTMRVLNGLQQGLPPVEKQVWKKIWKIGAPNKIKHFLWRALSGALAVKKRLRSRGIQLDTTCSVCSNAAETVCHALFTCLQAQEVWVKSNIRLPTGGFSRNSVFLNLHHLAVSNGGFRNTELNGTFPWIIWEIWKAMNVLSMKRNKQVQKRCLVWLLKLRRNGDLLTLETLQRLLRHRSEIGPVRVGSLHLLESSSVILVCHGMKLSLLVVRLGFCVTTMEPFSCTAVVLFLGFPLTWKLSCWVFILQLKV